MCVKGVTPQQYGMERVNYINTFCSPQHDHPYISAMVNNGTIHYDHDRDGTHGQMSGCTVSQSLPSIPFVPTFVFTSVPLQEFQA